ncbi:hypothetical protein L0152_24850 [bacterium]|nr:hypothetical protein [bacterium]
MKRVSLFVAFLVLFSGSICFSENIILSALSTNKKLILLNIEYANKKYKVVDSAVFNLPVQGGLTAMAPLPDGRAQVVWTSSASAQGMSSNAIIKIKSMIVDSNLNMVGPIKTLPPSLASHYNFSIISEAGEVQRVQHFLEEDPGFSEFSFQAANKVVTINRNLISGNSFGPKDAAFTIPGTANQFDTNFIGDIYAGLRYDSSRYNFVCGNANNAAPTVIVPFVPDVISSTMLPIPNSNNFNFILMKRTNTPQKISVENFQINGETCLPIKDSLIHLPPVNQNLGQLAFFNGITSTPSETSPNGGHVLLIRSSNDGTNIVGYHVNTLSGKKDSPPTVIGVDLPKTPEELFLFGLFVAGGATLFNR